MVNELGKYQILEYFYHWQNSIILRGINKETKQKVMIKTLNKEIYDSVNLSKLKNEYNLLKTIDSEYIIKTYEFLKMESKFYIIEENYEGVLLWEYIKNNEISIYEFINLAIEIFKGIEDIHKNNIIHKNINTFNILYNPVNKKIKIINFEIASEFLSEMQHNLNPNNLEGNLNYISPEQTGRINRPIDFRADFYSVGIVFYELLSGRLPFYSEDLSELIYYHIAKTPLPLHEINPEIPQIISRFVSKLMAKMPEQRYKSAKGIIYDLELFLKELKENGKIENFALGAGDISDKLEIPKKLYGRELEIKKLYNCFEESSKSSTTMIVIGGYSGIGKTTLVNELSKQIIKQRGIFIGGKFDQFSKNIPFSAFFQSINQFCSYILSEPKSKITEWKIKITKALGINGKLITDAVPSLELIIGKQNSNIDATPFEEQSRFKVAIQDMMSVISSPQHPLVIFMDDIHWADISSLEILEATLSNERIKGLLIISTYRDNEVDSFHPLIKSIKKIENNGGNLEFINLNKLTTLNVAILIQDILKCDSEEGYELAEVICTKTLGNPFYIIEFLKYCSKEKLIYLENNHWKWDIKTIKESKVEENVVEFLIKKMEVFPKQTIDIILIAVCIGETFDIKMISEIIDKDSEYVLYNLKPAIFSEIIYSLGNRNGNPDLIKFRFCHDKFQQAGSNFLTTEKKREIHLSIAKYYEKKEKLTGSSYLFKIAENYLEAFDLTRPEEEIKKTMEIFLKAAHSAAMSSAFDIAKQYLEYIIKNLPDFLNKDDSFLFSIYAEYHMVLFSLAQLEKSDKIYDLLAKLRKSPEQISDSCCLQAISLSNRGQYEKAFLLGVSLLEELGIDYPEDNLIDVIQEGIEKYYDFLKNNGLEKLDNMEVSNSSKEKAIAKILNRIMTISFFYNPLSTFWAVVTEVNRMVEKGITSEALTVYTGLISILIPFKNDYYTGYISSKKAMELAEKLGFSYELYRIYHLHSLISMHWFEPLENCSACALDSYKGNMHTGDFEYACFSLFTVQQSMIEYSSSIDDVQVEVESSFKFALKKANKHSIDTFKSFTQLLKALKGTTASWGSFNDSDFDEMQHVQELGNNKMALCYYYVYRSLSAVIFGDFETSLTLTESAIPILQYVTGFYIVGLHNFLHSLSLSKTIVKMKESPEKTALQDKLILNQKWLFQRAKDSPTNFQHLYDLIEAEINIQQNNQIEASILFEKAIEGAEKSKRPYHYALACELAGIRYLKVGIKRTAALFLKESYTAFLEWGSLGKTEQMKEKYENLLVFGITQLKNINQSFQNKDTELINLNSLDLNAVIKASQTISKEVKSEEVLKKLMFILLENSGAQKIYYLTRVDEEYVIEVQGYADNDNKIVQSKLSATNKIPQNIINYVQISQETVVLDNAEESGQFGNDIYIVCNHSKSILCLPVLNKDKILGLLYLENNLINNAFNQYRVEILKTIASQLAISLENAYLYDHLENLIAERTANLEKEISELEKTQNLLIELGTHDYLTGLSNRGSFVDKLRHSLNLAKRNNYTVCLLFIDLDSFKIINDKFGHDSGDIVLKTVAKRLKDSVRDCDIVSRFGGDEFTIILENINDVSKIHKTCERIIDSIKKTIPMGKNNGQVTASIGISIFPTDCIDIDNMIKKADEAMYEAKKLGKNRYVLSMDLPK